MYDSISAPHLRQHIQFTPIRFESGWRRHLDALHIPLLPPGANRFVDWQQIHPRFETHYMLETTDSIMEAALSLSALRTRSHVLMDFGFLKPIVRLPVPVFIDNWVLLVSETLFLGSVVVSEDGALVMEFTDDAEFRLFSNFPVLSE